VQTLAGEDCIESAYGVTGHTPHEHAVSAGFLGAVVGATVGPGEQHRLSRRTGLQVKSDVHSGRFFAQGNGLGLAQPAVQAHRQGVFARLQTLEQPNTVRAGGDALTVQRQHRADQRVAIGIRQRAADFVGRGHAHGQQIARRVVLIVHAVATVIAHGGQAVEFVVGVLGSVDGGKQRNREQQGEKPVVWVHGGGLFVGWWSVFVHFVGRMGHVICPNSGIAVSSAMADDSYALRVTGLFHEL
jgi:hypothetical protein